MKKLRNEAFLADKNSLMIEHDYFEALKAEFDMEINSEEIGFECTIPIEGSTCEYHNKNHNDEKNQVKVKMYFHSHFSYDSYQNDANKFEHMNNLIQWMYEVNVFI